MTMDDGRVDVRSKTKTFGLVRGSRSLAVIAGKAQPPRDDRPAVTTEEVTSALLGASAGRGDESAEPAPATDSGPPAGGDPDDVPDAQATRRRQADRLIRMGSNYLNAGMKRKAAGKFQQVLDDFADLPQADQARRLLLHCR